MSFLRFCAILVPNGGSIGGLVGPFGGPNERYFLGIFFEVLGVKMRVQRSVWAPLIIIKNP